MERRGRDEISELPFYTGFLVGFLVGLLVPRR
jgi:hypothetical protein